MMDFLQIELHGSLPPPSHYVFYLYKSQFWLCVYQNNWGSATATIHSKFHQLTFAQYGGGVCSRLENSFPKFC